MNLDTITLREAVAASLVDDESIDVTNAIWHMRDRIAKVVAVTPLNLDTPFDIDEVDFIIMRAGI